MKMSAGGVCCTTRNKVPVLDSVSVTSRKLQYVCTECVKNKMHLAILQLEKEKRLLMVEQHTA